MLINLSLDRKSLSLALVVSLFFALATPVIFPHWRLLFFAPFLVIFYYQKSYFMSLWASFFCGVFIDIFSGDTRIGLHGLGYCLTTFLLYGQRRHFFSDNLSTLPLMTLFFSVISTVIELVLMNVIEHPVGVSWQWVLTDLVYMPFFDALYSFIFFVFPFLFFSSRPKRGRDYFIR